MTSGLSVAETHAVRRGNPLVGIALVGVVVLALGCLTAAFVLVSRPHDDRDAREAVRSGVNLLIQAESGRSHACSRLTSYLAGPATSFRPACRALVGEDPGANLVGVRAGAVHRAAERGAVRLSGTLVDDHGRHSFDRDFAVIDDDGWKLDWDRAPVP